MSMELQKVNQERILDMKKWEADAFLFVLLYCCAKEQGDDCIARKWDLSKICALYELVGDIYSWKGMKELMTKVIIVSMRMGYYHDFVTKTQAEREFKEYLRSHADLKTNLRLTPREHRPMLVDLCKKVTSYNRDAYDAVIFGIILEEIGEAEIA